MDTANHNDLQPTFRALADPTRREILLLLSQQDMSIGEVCEHFEVTRAAVKKHLTILEEGSLITVRTHGRERINHLAPSGLKQVSDWMSYFDQFWTERLGRLQQAIERNNVAGKSKKNTKGS